MRLGIAAAASALVFCCGLAWAARGIVADVRLEQMAAEARLLAALDLRYVELAGRIIVVETRLGIRGGAFVMPRDMVPASNGD